jgi:MFS transporter, ACS family, hexuronate transporter
MMPSRRWSIAIVVTAAIAISYFDRQTLPVAVDAIRKDFAVTDVAFSKLNSAFLLAYALMYLAGGRLVDAVGTRRGFFLVMVVWSIACALHGLADGLIFLTVCRFLLGLGEGGGIPAATKAVAEWFPMRERSAAIGLFNAGTAVGAVAAAPAVALIIAIANWRWAFFVAGAIGLAWTVWWLWEYYPPAEDSRLSDAEREEIKEVFEQPAAAPSNTRWIGSVENPTPEKGTGTFFLRRLRENEPVPGGVLNRTRWIDLLALPQVWGLVLAKCLSDGAWFFYSQWLPKYLYDMHHFKTAEVGIYGWIPYAASGIGSLVGGGYCAWLLRRGYSLNFSRKLVLGLSAACMPWVFLVTRFPANTAIVLFSLAFFGQQSWSTLVMILPTDIFPKSAVGSVAGLVGFGGAMGGVVFGQLVGYLLDRGFGYDVVFALAGSFHVIAFLIVCVAIPSIQPLPLRTP